MGSWNMQQHRDSDLFCFGGGRICGVFPPLLRFGAEHPHLPLFLLHIRTASFEPIKNLAILDAQKIQVFDGNPLYHCYNLIYMKKTAIPMKKRPTHMKKRPVHMKKRRTHMKKRPTNQTFSLSIKPRDKHEKETYMNEKETCTHEKETNEQDFVNLDQTSKHTSKRDLYT